MEIFFGVIVFIVSLFIEANLGVLWNMPGIGYLFAVCVFGAAILWVVRNPKN